METLVAPLVWLAALVYLAAPVYAGLWIWRQKSRQRSIALGVRYLIAWLVTIALVLQYILSGAWYGESTSLGRNVIDAVVMLAIFVVLPVTSIIHLWRSADHAKS